MTSSTLALSNHLLCCLWPVRSRLELICLQDSTQHNLQHVLVVLASSTLYICHLVIIMTSSLWARLRVLNTYTKLDEVMGLIFEPACAHVVAAAAFTGAGPPQCVQCPAPSVPLLDGVQCIETMHQSAAVKSNTNELDKVYTPIYIKSTINSNAACVFREANWHKAMQNITKLTHRD
ncbi:hypothetical protein C8R44DRAFT_729670 [Mycena epipterygia]|nr:hypothetical protein C8R44DRAFT_729670 [Mycena epipterygia]